LIGIIRERISLESIIHIKKAESSDSMDKRICVFERGSQFELLSEVRNTFMRVSPVPEKLLKLYGLIQKSFSTNAKKYKDALIYEKNYRFSLMDKIFLEELEKVKRQD
jgi:hypothetical protein